MSGVPVELLDLLARWIHLIAGIMWIGNSLLFNWLDRELRPAQGMARTAEPIGTTWLLHSGGFYYVEKTLLAGAPLPRPLHWFKWQAYTTWWSGAALLVVVYYAGGRALLEDAGVARLSHAQAVALGAGAIVGGLLLYEAVQRLVAQRAPRLAAVLWITGLAAIAVGLTRLLSGRAAFLHVGAMLGTIMAANVVFTIVPSQRALVASVAEGRGGDPRVSARAKRVSIHNNYFTFPVLALMVSGHFPALYSHPQSWLLVFALTGSGVAVRHLLNLRFTYPFWRPALAGTLAGSVLLLFALLRLGAAPPGGAATAGSAGPVSFQEVRHVIDRRCGACHSARQADPSFGPAPGGVLYDTPEQIVSLAARIRERAFVTRTMPPGNRTRITDEERALLGRWVEQGAQRGEPERRQPPR
ncbi:MAG TPA: urate hydroxylase PuuD [Gemmatimonadales bacterium]|nr:urate hydroxylase PuuD [Gemmatimonadales bacterium]